jgi:hypothetical protein
MQGFGRLFIKTTPIVSDESMDKTLVCDVHSNETCVANVQNDYDLTMAKLEQLHLKFAHVSANKLLYLLKFAGKLVTTEALNRLYEITKKCFICQRFDHRLCSSPRTQGWANIRHVHIHIHIREYSSNMNMTFLLNIRRI